MRIPPPYVYRMLIQPVVYALMQLMLVVTNHYSTGATSCNSRLLSDRSQVPDSAFEHSSAVNLQHGASAARDIINDAELQERAWCPDAKIHTELREYMQVDLGQQRIIKLIITKGRVAQSKGRQVTPFFYIKYRREATGIWFEYRKDNGTQRMNGNRDAMTENYNTMEPPFVARFIRIYPFSLEPRKTCLKIELLGCDAHGVVEYQVPQGTLLADSMVPTYTYEPRQLDPRARFQDTGYDFMQADSRTSSRSSLHYPLFGQSQLPGDSPTTILRGGLGKLTDNDTEINKGVRPFVSYKYMGWKRQFSQQQLQSSWSHEDEHVRILFRFDAIYNFTAVRLFLANDFTHEVSLPRNITVQCSLHYPASTDQRPDSSVPLVVISPRTDRTNSAARWIVMSASQTQWHTVLSRSGEETSMATVPGSESVQHKLNRPSNLGIGRFVDVRLYFDAPWIVLGEVAFENEKLDLNELDAKTAHALYSSNSGRSIGDGTVENDKSSPNNTRGNTGTGGALATDTSQPSSSFPIGQSTWTLGTICGILAALIGVGVITLCFLWRQKRMRSRFEQHFHRGKRSINGADHFDCLSEVQTPSVLPPSNQPQLNTSLVNPMDSLMNSCEPAQSGTLYRPVQTSLLLGAKNHTEFAHTLRGPFGQMVDPNYQADPTPNTPKLPVDLTAHHVRNEFDARFGLGDQAVPASTVSPQSMHFIPFVSPQATQLDFRPQLTHTSTMKQNGLPDDPFIVLPMHDGAIYTSLPGSDCDSQPYARISSNGDTDRRYSRTMDFQGKPFHLFVQPSQPHQQQQSTENSAFRNLPQPGTHPVFSTLLPPPPTLPLPMPPGPHFSSSPSQSSTSHSQTPDDLANSGTPLVSADLINGVGNGCRSSEAKDLVKTRWLHVKHPSLATNHGPALSHQLRFLRGQSVAVPSSQQQPVGVHSPRYPIMDAAMHLHNIPGSEYSNTTMGSSTNAYGAYYGTPNMMSRMQHNNLDGTHDDMQIHR